MLKFYYEGRFFCLFKSYGKTFFIVLLVQLCYLFLLYFIASGLNIKKTIKAIKNAIPSYKNAFYSMSSRKTIPVTTDCAEKNKADEKLVDMAVPIAASVHLVGSSITLPLLVLVTAFLFTGIVPDFYTFFTFVFS